MPYEKNADLPKSVRDSLPDAAQTIYRKAYNSAHESNPDYNEERLAKISWGAVKRVYKKKDGDWVRSEMYGAEVPASNYDSINHIVKAIKIGTVAHTPEGEPFECNAEWLETHAVDWTGGKLIANHNGAMSESFGDITRSWWETPFVMMEIGNMSTDAETRMMSDQHTGFSFDAVGYPDDPDNVFGTDLSILFFPHYPACPATEGCGLASETKDILRSQNVITEDLKSIQGSEAMAEDKTYTRAEIDSMKAEAADVAAELATLKTEAKTHEGGVAALKAEIAERTDKISEMTKKAGEMFSAEDVEAKVTETKETMFSAEDVEAAKTEAIAEAIVAEKEKTELIAAELDAVNKMFPDGLATEFREAVVAMITEGKTHDALVKIGTIEFKELKANIPASAAGEGGKEEEIVASVGTYDPRTKEWV